MKRYKTNFKTCPICGKQCFSKNIHRGCFQYYCCGRPFEGPVVDTKDMAVCDSKDYND